MRNTFFYLTRKITPYCTILNDQGIIINKKKQNHTEKYISIDQKNTRTSSSVKLLGVQIDDKLNFNLHITKICRSASNQLYTLIRLQMFLNFEEKKTLTGFYPSTFLQPINGSKNSILNWVLKLNLFNTIQVIFCIFV